MPSTSGAVERPISTVRSASSFALTFAGDPALRFSGDLAADEVSDPSHCSQWAGSRSERSGFSGVDRCVAVYRRQRSATPPPPDTETWKDLRSAWPVRVDGGPPVPPPTILLSSFSGFLPSRPSVS